MGKAEEDDAQEGNPLQRKPSVSKERHKHEDEGLLERDIKEFCKKVLEIKMEKEHVGVLHYDFIGRREEHGKNEIDCNPGGQRQARNEPGIRLQFSFVLSEEIPVKRKNEDGCQREVGRREKRPGNVIDASGEEDVKDPP